jgi:hypothetical protein
LTRTGALLLALFENSTANLIRSFCSARNIAVLPVQKCEQPTRNPFWWRLRNFRVPCTTPLASWHSSRRG